MVEIKNEELKLALIKAQIDADVVLLALNRIDEDDKFRDALAALMATNVPDKTTVIANFVNGQASSTSAELTDLTPEITTKELVHVLNTKAVQTAARLLKTDALKEHIQTMVSTRVDELIGIVLGYKKRFNQWEMDYTNDRHSTARNAIETFVASHVGPMLQRAIAEQEDVLVAHVKAWVHDTMVRATSTYYKEACEQAIKKQVRQWMENRAQLDIEKLFAELDGKPVAPLRDLT
jgi:hypothetical protein